MTDKMTAAMIAGLMTLGVLSIPHPVAAAAGPADVDPVPAPWTCDDPTASLSDEQFQACMDEEDWDCSVLGNTICYTL